MLFPKQPTSMLAVGSLNMSNTYSASSFRIALKSARLRSEFKSGSVSRRFNIAGSLKTPASIARRINETAVLADFLSSVVLAEIKAASKNTSSASLPSCSDACSIISRTNLMDASC